MEHPSFVEIQYWNSAVLDWGRGHAGISLMNPAAYVQKLAKRGVIARAIVKETGDVVYGEGADLL